MFDFEKLEVYRILHKLNVEVFKYLNQDSERYPYLKDHWKRATMSAELNLVKSVGQMIGQDKMRFLLIARSSVFECVTLLNVLSDLEVFDMTMRERFYEAYTSVSKMLLAMYRSYTKDKLPVEPGLRIGPAGTA